MRTLQTYGVCIYLTVHYHLDIQSLLTDLFIKLYQIQVRTLESSELIINSQTILKESCGLNSKPNFTFNYPTNNVLRPQIFPMQSKCC